MSICSIFLSTASFKLLWAVERSLTLWFIFDISLLRFVVLSSRAAFKLWSFSLKSLFIVEIPLLSVSIFSTFSVTLSTNLLCLLERSSIFLFVSVLFKSILSLKNEILVLIVSIIPLSRDNSFL